VALSKWWSNASEATLDCTITFHGLLPESRLITMVCVFFLALSILYSTTMYVESCTGPDLVEVCKKPPIDLMTESAFHPSGVDK